MAGERTMTATGRILGLQHSSTVDGPGTRSAVLFKGCSPACAWCRSAESRSTETEIWFLPGRCIACDSCLEVCPQARVTQADGLPAVGSAYCTRCGSCVEACTTGARTLAGRETTVEELLAEVESQRPIYAGSGGGVTFSGGEPLRQPEFLRACLEVFRERGIPTAVHTQGYEPADLLRGLAPLSDLFLYDLKLIDDVRHAALTGVPATPILRNLEALVATGAEIWVRLALIPGVNDDTENLRSLGGFLRSLGRVSRVLLLPYARAGHAGGEALGHPRPVEASAPPAAGSVETAQRVLAAFHFPVQVGR